MPNFKSKLQNTALLLVISLRMALKRVSSFRIYIICSPILIIDLEISGTPFFYHFSVLFKLGIDTFSVFQTRYLLRLDLVKIQFRRRRF
jgi:hypothetical protein